MTIKFEIIYPDNHIRFVEMFGDFKSFDFDMAHYDENNNKITTRPAFNYPIRKTLRNLVRNANNNNAKVRIIERNSN